METSEVKIKVGIPVSYDYRLLEYSLPRLYPYADAIYLAIDKERKTWKGNSYPLPDTFFAWIQNMDKEKKIHLYEDSFYIEALSPMTLETRTRNMLAKRVGYDGWHVQLDADEYFCNFGSFARTLKSLDVEDPIKIYAQWTTLFKQDETGFFYVRNREKFPVATNAPYYIYARIPAWEGKCLILDETVIHQSWARSKAELQQKLQNWGHANDFDSNAYLDFWESVDLSNYRKIKDFHPLTPSAWTRLNYIQAKNIPELMKKWKKKS